VERTIQLTPMLVRSLEELLRAKRDAPAPAAAIGLADRRVLQAATAAVGLAQDVRRTKGKVRAWCEPASEPDVASAAETLAAAARTIEWLAAPAAPASATRPAMALAGPRAEEVPAPARPSGRGALRRAVIIAASRTGMKSRLRAIDTFIERRLSRRKNGRLLARYVALRARVKPFLA
jgi:hypothetical protein